MLNRWSCPPKRGGVGDGGIPGMVGAMGTHLSAFLWHLSHWLLTAYPASGQKQFSGMEWRQGEVEMPAVGTWGTMLLWGEGTLGA